MSDIGKWLRGMASAMVGVVPRAICAREWKGQRQTRLNERPIEYAWVFECIRNQYPRRLLDVGTGRTALPSLLRSCGLTVDAVDNIRDYWTRATFNRHYHVMDTDITSEEATRDLGPYDVITCISVLEHIPRSMEAMRNMARALRRGGQLILTTPYSELQYRDNVYKLPGSAYGQNAPYVTQAFSRECVRKWESQAGLRCVREQLWECWTGPFWTAGEQVVPPKAVTSAEAHQLGCFLFERT